MQILILEDSVEKLEAIQGHISTHHQAAEITVAACLGDYISLINRRKFDLLVVDLVIPSFKGDADAVESTESIIENTRGDYKCPNFRTPAIAVTSFDEKAEENFRSLNIHDFSIITFSVDNLEWQDALNRKIEGIKAAEKFDFVIICALQKEADAFIQLQLTASASELISGLVCRRIEIGGKRGVIVTCPRMGLVSSAITATAAIEAFRPAVICMAGICGGIADQANIYDTVIAETCHQHDSGKWAADTFKPEVYSNAINHRLLQRFRIETKKPEFIEEMKRGISLSRSEFPKRKNDFEARIYDAPASSGSAVVANEKMVDLIANQQRKSAIFEMESYALYEAARLHPSEPFYFSAKTVVDDGGRNKGDAFHRVACLLSARAVSKLLLSCEFP